MSSSPKDDAETEKDTPDDSPNHFDYNDEYDEQWDEWYDEGESYNKKTKIRRAKKRLYVNRDEW